MKKSLPENIDKMKNYEIIGDIYKQIREKKLYTREQVSKDLISIRLLARFEEEEKLLDFLTIERLFQRIGTSSDMFSIIMMRNEYEYLDWRKQIADKALNGKITNTDWESNIAHDRSINPVLQEQFVLFWKGYSLGDDVMMKNAICLTIPEFPDHMTTDQCIGREEIAYMLYYIEKNRETQNAIWIEEYDILKFVLKYINLKYEQKELMRIYGRAACVYGESDCVDNVNDKINHYKAAFDLQRKYARINGMERILKGLIKAYKEMEQLLPDGYRHMHDVISSIKKEFHIQENAGLEIKITNEIYLFDEMLREYRLERGFSVKQAAEGVCNDKTYRALENGKRRPKNGTYKAIAERLGINLGKYNADMNTSNYEHFEILDEINLIARKDIKGREQKLIDLLEYKLGDLMKYPKNRQLIEGVREIQNLLTGNIPPEEYLKLVNHQLDLTIDDWHENMEHHFYTTYEAKLVYYAAVAYRRMKKPDIAIKIVDNILKYIDESRVDLDYRISEKLQLMILKKNLLTDLEIYDEPAEIALEEIEFAFWIFRGDRLHDCLFEIGWMCENGYWPEKMKCIDKDNFKKYFEYALCISELFYIEKDQKVIKKYMQSIFDIV